MVTNASQKFLLPIMNKILPAVNFSFNIFQVTINVDTFLAKCIAEKRRRNCIRI